MHSSDQQPATVPQHDVLINKLANCYTSVIHDVMREMGVTQFTLPPRIAPLQPDSRLCGPVFTIEGYPTDSADPHDTLLAWTGLLSQCPRGHIWTVQPHTNQVAQMGELSAETLHHKGVLGSVIDGPLRDADFLLRLGFRCWRTHHTPRDIVGRWLPKATGGDIFFDDVLIRNGDWLHGDRDGMVRIPAEKLSEVVERATKAMATENLVRKAILAGEDPQAAYRKYNKF